MLSLQLARCQRFHVRVRRSPLVVLEQVGLEARLLLLMLASQVLERWGIDRLEPRGRLLLMLAV